MKVYHICKNHKAGNHKDKGTETEKRVTDENPHITLVPSPQMHHMHLLKATYRRCTSNTYS